MTIVPPGFVASIASLAIGVDGAKTMLESTTPIFLRVSAASPSEGVNGGGGADFLGHFEMLMTPADSDEVDTVQSRELQHHVSHAGRFQKPQPSCLEPDLLS